MVLPSFELTELSFENDPAATKVVVLSETYYTRPKLVPEEGRRRDGKARWVKHQFNLFPVVVDSLGVPWAEANVYVLSRLEAVLKPDMLTYGGIAEDLAAYRNFLDENDIDWMDFPEQKFARPTYRFHGHLKFAINAGDTERSTANRRISTVVNFYRWLGREGVLKPANPAWKESDQFLHFHNAQGFGFSKKVKVTDLRLKIHRQADPYDGYIDDGGKLRPLPRGEQEWVMDALETLGNTEMTLIHLFELLTGARIQTTLTFRVRHALLKVAKNNKGDVRLPVGPGTGIDTKWGKQMVLHIPAWFYEDLNTYALSDRARSRRERAVGGDHENQYLFLSQRGAPLYQAKEDTQAFNSANKLRHQKVGQAVRQFRTDRVIPFIRQKHSAPDFWYRLHDLRATAGMNWTDRQLQLVAQGQATLHEAREYVRVRMGHSNAAITDRYLNYRQNLKLVRWVEEEYESHLKELASQALKKLR